MNRQNSLGATMQDDDAPKSIYRAPLVSAKAIAARKGYAVGKTRAAYLARLEQARLLLAAGLSNLEVAQRMGVAANSIPAFKRALGIEVVGYRKGTGRRTKTRSQS